VPDNNPEIKKEATSNPLAEHLNITVSLPDTIQVKMVDAKVLEDYEIWFFISSLLFAAVVGFGVPFLQSCETATGADTMLAANTGVWLILFGVSLIIALRKRHILKCKSREVTFKATKF
jgi:hypothetical protein